MPFLGPRQSPCDCHRVNGASEVSIGVFGSFLESLVSFFLPSPKIKTALLSSPSFIFRPTLKRKNNKQVVLCEHLESLLYEPIHSH